MDYIETRLINNVIEGISRATIKEILARYVKAKSPEELSKEIGVTSYQAHSLLDTKQPYFREVAELCCRLGLDLGITIREPGGLETTFYVEENFSNASRSTKEKNLAAKAIE